MFQRNALYPSILVGGFADEALLALISDGESDQQSLPCGELRMLLPMPFGGYIVQVYTVVEGQLLWFRLVPPAHRIEEVARVRREIKTHWQLGDLLVLQKIDRKTLRWYPSGFADAAFQVGEHVRLRIDDTCMYEGIIQRYVLYHDPENTIGITTYDLELQLAPQPNQVTRYALEHEIERISERAH